MNNVIIAGCGYLGQFLAKHHLAAADQVLGLVAGEASVTRLARQSVRAMALDLDGPAPIPLPDAVHGSLLYWLVPPPRTGEEDSRSARFLASLGECLPRRVVLISTTGVYGDCGGAWVDEQRAVAPRAPRALRRLSAERQWRDWAQRAAVELVILRVAGFYGPGRLPLARLRQGAAMLCAEASPWSNRIHVDDLLSACVAAMQRGGDGEVYNVSDGQPSTMLDYFNRVADQAGLSRPPQIDRAQAEQQLSAEMMSYLDESRRIDNRKMLQQLAVVLRYPVLDDGLRASLAGEVVQK
jgi:nucleoside-diphosphate-sugar epimerase